MSRTHLTWEILLLFCAFFLPGYVSQAENPGARFADLPAVTSAYLIMAIPQVLLILYIIGIRKEATLSEFGVVAPDRRDPLRVLIVYAGVFALLIPFLIVSMLLPASARSVVLGGYRWSLRGASQLPIAFIFSIVSGYREELFFRSYLLTRLSQLGAPEAFSVAATAVLFSLGHLYEGPMGIAITALQGVYLAIVFLRLKNLHVIAAVHGLYNFTVFCVSLFGGSPLPRPG
jgi:hypothetical protein